MLACNTDRRFKTQITICSTQLPRDSSMSDARPHMRRSGGGGHHGTCRVESMLEAQPCGILHLHISVDTRNIPASRWFPTGRDKPTTAVLVRQLPCCYGRATPDFCRWRSAGISTGKEGRTEGRKAFGRGRQISCSRPSLTELHFALTFRGPSGGPRRVSARSSTTIDDSFRR